MPVLDQREFGRALRLTVSGPSLAIPGVQQAANTTPALVVEDLRVRFVVTRTLKKSPNTSDITITNLSSKSRDALCKKPLQVKLEVGYGDNLRLLTFGDVLFGMSETKGADWETLLQSGEGLSAFAYARANKHYPAGTPVRKILTDVAESMGLGLPSNLINNPALDSQFSAGYVSSGAARDELTTLLAPYGYHWSVQNNRLAVLLDTEVHSDSAYVISEDVGMIGSPQHGSPPKSGKPPHLTVKVLLYPELTPGDLVQLQSKTLNGLYRLEKVVHRGDLMGAEWTSECELAPYVPQ